MPGLTRHPFTLEIKRDPGQPLACGKPPG